MTDTRIWMQCKRELKQPAAVLGKAGTGISLALFIKTILSTVPLLFERLFLTFGGGNESKPAPKSTKLGGLASYQNFDEVKGRVTCQTPSTLNFHLQWNASPSLLRRNRMLRYSRVEW